MILIMLKIKKRSIRKIKHDDFYTQLSIGKSRPDIVLDSSDLLIVFEIKTQKSTSMTKSQKKSYIEVFKRKEYKNKNKKVLVFITPENYHHLIDIKNNKIKTICVTWEEIINLIDEHELNLVSRYLDDFSLLLKSWYLPEKINFTYKEVKTMQTNNIPIILKKLRAIVDDIHALSNEYDHYSYTAKNWSEHALYFTDLGGNDILHFGIWMNFWEEKKYPLCISVDKDSFSKKAVKIFLKEFSNENSLYSEGNWISVAVDMDILENESVSEEIWEKKLKFLLDKIL